MKIDGLIEKLGNIDDRWIEEYAEAKEGTTGRRFTVIKRVAAAAAVLVISFAVLFRYSPAFAEKMKALFGGYIGKDESVIKTDKIKDINDKVVTGIYCDENENLRFEVLESLSDGMHVYMTVRYTALSENGKSWLDDCFTIKEETLYGKTFRKTDFHQRGHNMSINEKTGFSEEDTLLLWLLPDKTAGYVDYGWGDFYEIYDRATETERYFLLSLQLTSEKQLDGQHIMLKYPLINDAENIIPDWIENNVDFVDYDLVPTESQETHRDIKRLRVSGLSYIIESDSTSWDMGERPEYVYLYVKDYAPRYIDSKCDYKRVVDNQDSKESKGINYFGSFNYEEDSEALKNSYYEKVKRAMKYGFKYDLENWEPEYEFTAPYPVYSFDKEKVEKIEIKWADGSVSAFTVKNSENK